MEIMISRKVKRCSRLRYWTSALVLGLLLVLALGAATAEEEEASVESEQSEGTSGSESDEVEHRGPDTAEDHTSAPVKDERLCRLENGLSSVIVDILESFESEVGQPTTPRELPIVGNPGSEINLEINYLQNTIPYFVLDGKELKLVKPLDRDEGDISSIVLQVTCSVRNSDHENRTIPVIVRVQDKNDNTPVFQNEPYETNVAESAPVGTTVFRNIFAHDIDAGVNSLVEYSIVDDRMDEGSDDSFGYFTINLPHQGVVTLNRTLDFEKHRTHYVTVRAKDRAFNEKDRRESFATLTVHVIDADDQGPTFIQKQCPGPDHYCKYAEYNATVMSGVLAGILDLSPERILAQDKDSIKAGIHYTIVNGSPPSYIDYFHIDSQTGLVRQVRPVPTPDESHFKMTIKATEISAAKRYALAEVHVHVVNVDNHPPVIEASSLFGFLQENSPVGTPVVDMDHRRIRLRVSDLDLEQNDRVPSYEFELTTSAFKIDDDGYLVVVRPEVLDRDPPFSPSLQFQIIAREREFGQSLVSSPVVMTINLLDANDNSPRLPELQPIVITGSDGRQFVAKIVATDPDEGINSQITYGLTHVSNNGSAKFSIDPISGRIEAAGSKLHSGDQYTLTIRATDGGGKSSDGILEVTVKNGPNVKAPSFGASSYDVSISEGSSIGSEVITLEAKDPEGDRITYAIVSGNELKHFEIGLITGKLMVSGPLDREDLSRYSLIVSATDEGGLATTTAVNVRILDINDRNPTFIKTPYNFKVKEGEYGKVIGVVEAQDDDESDIIRYETPVNSPVQVNPVTGEITIKSALDYERERVHHVIVTARDASAIDSRIATTTVTIVVEDMEDEEPVFKQFTYDVNVEENLAKTKVVQVQAWDPDTTKKITYFIKQGPHDKFHIDSSTGEIRTTQGLDFEEANQHILIIGLEENMSGNIGSTTTVIVHVVDVNDVPPVFTLVPPPIRLDDTIAPGTVITRLEAVDADGSAPFNKVRYDVFGRGKAPRFFEVDHETGVIRVKDDLRKEINSEYELDIRAYDLGALSLSSVATVHVHVDHTVTLPPDLGVGFADTEYTVELPEGANGGTLVKLLTIVNKPNDIIPIECEIIAGNADKLFDVRVTKEKNCLVSVASPHLDFEKASSYKLQVRLMTLAGIISSHRSITKLHIKLTDENDNVPFFIFPNSQKVAKGQRLFSGISENAQISTPVIQVKADDKDSGNFGEVSFSLDAETPLALSYFQIDSKSGVVSSKKEVNSISPAMLPFRFTVLAKDNNSPGVSHIAHVELVINVINEAHRLILAIDGTSPDRVKSKENDLIEIMQEFSNLVVGIEKITTHHYLETNGSIVSDPSGTDVWFYCVDPLSGYILERENNNVQATITSHEGSKKIIYFISSKLSMRAREIRKPVTLGPLLPARVGPVENGRQWAAFPAALVALASLIFIVSVAGICFICYKWSNYTQYKSQVERVTAAPHYEHMYVQQHSPSFTSFKQYETQILQMRVQNDDDDAGSRDLHIDTNTVGSSRHHLYHDGNPDAILDATNYSHLRQPPVLRTFQHTIEEGMPNPIYERSDDDEDHIFSTDSERGGDGYLSQSQNTPYHRERPIDPRKRPTRPYKK